MLSTEDNKKSKTAYRREIALTSMLNSGKWQPKLGFKLSNSAKQLRKRNQKVKNLRKR